MKRRNERQRKSKASRRVIKPRSQEYSRLSPRKKDAYARAVALIYDLRKGEAPYSKLLRKHNLDSRTARRYAGRYLLGGERGKNVRARRTDMLVRELNVPRRVGDVPEFVRGSKAATQLSDYYSDRESLLNDEMRPGEFEAKWRGTRINGRELLADAAAIFRMVDAGVLKLDDLYGSVGPER